MPIRVTHSLVDCVALAIHTPVGVVLHTGDFKIDLSPPDGKPFDLHAFAELGKQGVLVLLQDSTNVDRHGYTPSETSGAAAAGRDLRADEEEAVLQLLLVVDPPDSAGDGAGA